MCGEKSVSSVSHLKVRGSPPHVRGKAGDGQCVYGLLRITPACAGKSLFRFRLHRFPGDHPRMCGEKRDNIAEQYMGGGSPPHVRGKAAVLRRSAVRPGITPACAGKSEFLFDFTRQFRITPACAGKRYKLYYTRTCKKDHPRMCGEKSAVTWCGLLWSGSPPHVRGKVYLPSSTIAPRLDHPRMCGEKDVLDQFSFQQRGSPPHVRGKESSSVLTSFSKGITPACAGKSKRIAPSSVLFGDHPRMCGEKTKKIP